MKKVALLLLIAISVCAVIVFLEGIGFSVEPPPPPPPVGLGDGYLLKRSQPEMCHSCHKTNLNTPSTDANWGNAIKMHSAEILGTCGNTTYKTKTECEDPTKGNSTWTAGEWNASGGWGISGGKYGEFVCTTCHTAHNTKNIYLIKETITTPDGTNFEGRATNSVIVDFRYKEAASGDADPAIGKLGKPNEDRSSLPDPKTKRVCEVCHTYNSVSASDGVTVHAYNMPATNHMGTTACTSCHPHTGGFAGSGCDGCHNSPPTIGKHSIHFGSGSVDYGSTTIQSTGGQYRFSCGICHNGTHKNSGASNPHDVEVSFTGVATQDPDSSPPAYSLPAPSVDDPGKGYTFNYRDGTCSNIYCHGNYPGSGNIASPAFNTGSAACGTCHGVYDAAHTTVYPNSGSHRRHVTASDTAYTYDRTYSCTLCHNGIVTGTTSYTIADKSKHVSGSVDWKFNTTDSRVSVSSAYSYTSGTAVPSNGILPNREYGTCTNVYCHSNVQPNGGAGAPDVYAAPLWGDIVSCGTCHSGDYTHTPGDQMNSGSHTAHLGYVFKTSSAATKCTICHKWNASATFDQCEQCHTSAGEQTSHVNGAIDVRFDTSFGSGTYNGASAPGNGYSNCSNTYCHGNYSGSGLNATPTWGGTVNCGTCHGVYDAAHTTVYPNSGSHRRHVTASDTAYTYDRTYSCTLCHNGIVTGTTSYTIADKSKHVSGSVDWKFNTTDSRLQGGSESYSITTGTAVPSDGTTPREYGTCTNVYCHSNVQPNGGAGAPDVYAAPLWGDIVSCGTCHSGDYTHTPGDQMNSGSHTAHLDYVFNTSSDATKCTICHKWNASATFDQCEQCHTSAGEQTSHVNGAIDVRFDTSFGSGTYNGASAPGNGYSNCSSTYCHSNGTGGTTNPGETRPVAVNTSANWGAGSLACNACHGTSTVGGTPDYTNGSPKANSHSAAGHAVSCDKCHVNTTIDGTTIAEKAYHVNRYYNVDAGGGVSFTYTYKPAGGTCAGVSVSCHTTQPADTTWGGP